MEPLMSEGASVNIGPPPDISEHLSRLKYGFTNIRATHDTAQVIGLSATPDIIAQTLEYLSAYVTNTQLPCTQVLRVDFASAEFCAWAQRMRADAVEIDGSRLSLSRGHFGNIGWHCRYENDIFYDCTMFSPDGIVALSANDNVMPRHLALARLVRNSLSAGLNASGAAYLHAGSVTIAGRGIVIFGDKFVGKTTQICELVARGAAFTSNDRVFLCPDGQVVGLPVSVNIRSETLGRYDSLAAWRNGAPENPHRVGMNVPDCDVSLSVSDFARAFNAAIKPQAPLNAVFRLVRDWRTATSFVELDGHEIGQIFVSGQFHGIDYSQPFWPYQRCSAAAIGQMIANRPIVACNIFVGHGQTREAACLIEDLVKRV